MTSAETTAENEQLSGSMLAIIDAYRMGAVIDAQDLYPRKTAPEARPPERAFVPADSSLSDGV